MRKPFNKINYLYPFYPPLLPGQVQNMLKTNKHIWVKFTKRLRKGEDSAIFAAQLATLFMVSNDHRPLTLVSGVRQTKPRGVMYI